MTNRTEQDENDKAEKPADDSKDDPVGNTSIKASDEKKDDGWQELMGKDLVMKSLKVTNPNAPSVQPQDAAIVDFTGRLAIEKCNENEIDDSKNPVFHEAKDWLIVVGEKDVVPVLEMGIRFMQEGESAILWSHSKFAYGPVSGHKHNNYTLPPDSHVMYHVTVKQIISGSEAESDDFKLKLCHSKKTIGNDIYKYELLGNVSSNAYAKSRSLMLYKRAAEMLEHIVQNSEDNEKQAFDLLLDCLNNMTAVHLSCKDYYSAKQAAVTVLSKDPNNTKGLLRAAKAALFDQASTYDEVQAALSAAAESSDPQTTKEVEKLRIQFQRQKQLYKQRKKKMQENFAKAMVSGNDSKEQDKRDTDNNVGEVDNESVPTTQPKNDKVKETKPIPPDNEKEVETRTTSTDEGVKEELSFSQELRKKLVPYAIQFFLTILMFLYFKSQQGKRPIVSNADSNADTSGTEGGAEL